MHAKELVRRYNCIAFYRLSVALDATEPTSLFDSCFGKLSSQDFDTIRYSRPLEHRIAAIYAQLNMAPPSIESTRRRKTSIDTSPSLSTYVSRPASTSAMAPTPVNMSTTNLLVSSDTDGILAFLASVPAMADEVLLWRIIMFADVEAARALDPTARDELVTVLQTRKQFYWLAQRIKG